MRLPENSRREVIKLLAGLTVGGVAALLTGSGYSSLVETRWLAHERVRLPLDGLPAVLDGLRIVQLSDFHAEPFTSLAFIERVVETSNRLEPDLVALTGDFVTSRAEAISELAPILARLEARYGVVGSLGNHDLWAGAGRIVRGLEAAGLVVLRNSGFTIDISGTRFYLAGLDSAWGGRPNLQQALTTAPDDTPVILLAHEPDLIDDIAADPRVYLQLSGHSHGGQVRLPGIGALVLPYLGRKYDLGLYRVGQSWLYTNRGIGQSGVPLRFNCRPELTEITLTRG